MLESDKADILAIAQRIKELCDKASDRTGIGPFDMVRLARGGIFNISNDLWEEWQKFQKCLNNIVSASTIEEINTQFELIKSCYDLFCSHLKKIYDMNISVVNKRLDEVQKDLFQCYDRICDICLKYTDMPQYIAVLQSPDVQHYDDVDHSVVQEGADDEFFDTVSRMSLESRGDVMGLSRSETIMSNDSFESALRDFNGEDQTVSGQEYDGTRRVVEQNSRMVSVFNDRMRQGFLQKIQYPSFVKRLRSDALPGLQGFIKRIRRRSSKVEPTSHHL